MQRPQEPRLGLHELVHPFIRWVKVTADVKGPRQVNVVFSCLECKDKTQRRYCCLERAKNEGMKGYATLHAGCQGKQQKGSL
jgi:hypothetical protein